MKEEIRDKLNKKEIERIKQIAFYELEDYWNSIRNELNKGEDNKC